MSPWTRLAYDARLLSHPPQLPVHGCQRCLHYYLQVCHFVPFLIGLLFHRKCFRKFSFERFLYIQLVKFWPSVVSLFEKIFSITPRY
jgi:hypothetical protein